MTDHYAVIGNPIAHSKSPAIHAAFARQLGDDIHYHRLLAPLDDFAGTARRFFAEGGLGLNITVPFKEQALALADEHGAPHLSACNTLRRAEDGRLWAYNTDGLGLVRDLLDNLRVPLAGRRILLLGAGGAARGVLLPLLQQAPACLTLANRTEAKARLLVDELDGETGTAQLETLAWSALASGEAQAFDLIINATSTGLGNEAMTLAPALLAPDCLAYDMMYGRDTPFLTAARAGGARLADGLGMLVEQAAEAYCIWRGKRPQTAAILQSLREGI